MYRLKLSDSQSKRAVEAYRTNNAAVPALWKNYEAAAVWAVKHPNKVIARNYCRFWVKEKFLWVQLPSGRKLAYREPQISWRETDWGESKETLEFMAVNSKTKKWNLERTWGGTLTENIVQATAREFLMHGMLRLEKAGYRALFSVHDEAICEREIGKGTLAEFVEILCELPEWAKGLPLEAKGWRGERYRK